jgi:hypothetical protein
VLLAVRDVCVKVLERLHVHRLEAGDQREALEFLARQANAVSQAKHLQSPWLLVSDPASLVKSTVCDGLHPNAKIKKEMIMHILTAEELSTIERDADRAPVQQLRLHVAQVTLALSSQEPDVAGYAGALLLKLERLIDEECVSLVGADTKAHGPKYGVEPVDAPCLLAEPVRAAAWYGCPESAHLTTASNKDQRRECFSWSRSQLR